MVRRSLPYADCKLGTSPQMNESTHVQRNFPLFNSLNLLKIQADARMHDDEAQIRNLQDSKSALLDVDVEVIDF